MYKVLIADDERVIREGIKRLVNWKALNLALVDMALDGREAYGKIREKRPDIVLTDIKMPGLNGIELIKRVKRELPATTFIVISGYDEFDFAREAMIQGVKHYLLKPTNEQEIESILREAIQELKARAEREHFIEKMKADVEKMLPLVKEQFLRDCIMNRLYSADELGYYRKLFAISEKEVQLILFQLIEPYRLVELLALERIAGRALRDTILLSTTAKDTVLALIRPVDLKAAMESITGIKNSFTRYYEQEFTAAVSGVDRFERIYALYREAREYLGHKFYIGAGGIITRQDIQAPEDGRTPGVIDFDVEDLRVSVKCGDREGAKEETSRLLGQLKRERPPKKLVTAYFAELLLSIIRQSGERAIEEYMEQIMHLRGCGTIQEAERIVRQVIVGLAEENQKLFRKRRSRLIQRLICQVEENLGNQELSLKWLAKNTIFANVDYLSKLFKREMGERFSQYLIRVRVERAKELLAGYEEDRVCNVAERVGFGVNSQYFSQVFKKQTGLSPREYRKKRG